MRVMVTITINGKELSVASGTTVLEAARSLGVEIPTLCHHSGLSPEGSCRLCMVEVEQRGRRRLVASCMFPVAEGLVVETETEPVARARRFVLGLLLDRSPHSEEIAELARRYGAVGFGRLPEGERDSCIHCGRCVRACEEEATGCLAFGFRGWERKVGGPYEEPPSACIGCGACAKVCPTGHIVMEESEDRRLIWGRTFDLLRCSLCGEPFATEEQLEFLGKGGEEERICERCRKRVFAASFTGGLR